MSFISRVIRFLFWLLVLSWSVALLRRVVAWMLRGGTAAPSRGVDVAGSPEGAAMAGRLVRDPVCGAHVAEVLAIPLREGGKVLHFCSIACRDEHLGAGAEKNTKKIAASG
jgi:YHS domain-containing protein